MNSTEINELARVIWNQPVNVIDWVRLNELAATGKGDYEETRDYTLATAAAILAAGYRKVPVEGSPS